MLGFALIFGIGIVAIAALDIYRLVKYGFEGTLSWYLYRNSLSYPIIPATIGFVVGLLFGHLFWDQLLTVNVCPQIEHSQESLQRAVPAVDRK